MAKIADEYLKVDSWKIIEDKWHIERNMVSESIFSLGNEYMGLRGCFEEGTTAESLPGSYFNGIYEIEPVENTSYKGIVQKTHFMVNASNWLYTRIFADEELLEPGSSDISEFNRELDLKSGTITRSYIWATKNQAKLKISFIRFLNMKNPEFGYQCIKIQDVGINKNTKEPVKIKVILAIDGNSLHVGRKKCYWDELATAVSSLEESEDKTSITNIKSKGSAKTGLNFTLPMQSACVFEQTKTTKQRVFSGFTWDISDSTHLDNALPIQVERFAGWELSLSLYNGETATINKKIANIVEKDAFIDDSTLIYNATLAIKKVSSTKFDDALLEQKEYWEDFWKHSDIEIEGDEKNQQGIRFCIFQMHQTYHGFNSSNNIGAKGLTGEAYNGHTFWDTETCCLPFFLFTDLKAAKNLLEYRYSTLKQAKERAIQLDCKGSCYPVATLNGEEACNLWQHASLQFQPSTGVAYGIHHYVNISNDKDFLYHHGIEMLIEITRFLISRGSWNQDKTGFGFYGVMGPDEFHMMVNNNAYTNFMAQQTFDYTLHVLSELENNDNPRYEEVIKDLALTTEELENIALCSKKMIILYNEETKLFEQHEGYFTLPHIDINRIPISDFPLYNNWSYDRIYRTDMIKQPDVLMFLYLHSSLFSSNVKLKNYEYYEPKTIHESSLSPSIHSILACEIGKPEEAFKFFAFATRMDLDNYNRNTKEGLHTTSIAAAWINIVYGFGGMRSDGEYLTFKPSLPKQWKKYSFRIVYKNSIISVCVSNGKASFSSSSNDIPVVIYNKKYQLQQEPLDILLEE